jgi:hypothetical protein
LKIVGEKAETFSNLSSTAVPEGILSLPVSSNTSLEDAAKHQSPKLRNGVNVDCSPYTRSLPFKNSPKSSGCFPGYERSSLWSGFSLAKSHFSTPSLSKNLQLIESHFISVKSHNRNKSTLLVKTKGKVLGSVAKAVYKSARPGVPIPISGMNGESYLGFVTKNKRNPHVPKGKPFGFSKQKNSAYVVPGAPEDTPNAEMKDKRKKKNLFYSSKAWYHASFPVPRAKDANRKKTSEVAGAEKFKTIEKTNFPEKGKNVAHSPMQLREHCARSPTFPFVTLEVTNSACSPLMFGSIPSKLFLHKELPKNIRDSPQKLNSPSVTIKPAVVNIRSSTLISSSVRRTSEALPRSPHTTFRLPRHTEVSAVGMEMKFKTPGSKLEGVKYKIPEIKRPNVVKGLSMDVNLCLERFYRYVNNFKLGYGNFYDSLICGHVNVKSRLMFGRTLEVFVSNFDFTYRCVIKCCADYSITCSQLGKKFPKLPKLPSLCTTEGKCYLNHFFFLSVVCGVAFRAKDLDLGPYVPVKTFANKIVEVYGERALNYHVFGKYTRKNVFHCDNSSHSSHSLHSIKGCIGGDETAPVINDTQMLKAIENVYLRVNGSRDSIIGRAVEKDLVDFSNEMKLDRKTLREVKVPFYMNENTQSTLLRYYPQYNLKFTHSVHSDHPAAAASRLLENHTLSTWCGSDFSDVGGCLLFHMNRPSTKSVHICRPIYDSKDAQRRIIRHNQLKKQHLDAKDIISPAMSISTCAQTLSDCKVKTSSMVMVQVYDAPLHEVCRAMITKETDCTYLTMITPGEILDKRECFYLEALDCEINLDKGRDELTYKFNSSCYTHRLSLIEEYMKTSHLIIEKYLFSIEMFEIRMGVNYYKILKSNVAPTIKCLKTLRYKRCSVDVVRVKLPRFNKKTRTCGAGFEYLYLDKKFVTRIFEFVVGNCSVVNSKTYEWVWNHIKSSKSRVVISGKVIHRDVSLDINHVEPFSAIMLAAGVRSRIASEYLAKNLHFYCGDASPFECVKFVLREKLRILLEDLSEALKRTVKSVMSLGFDLDFLDLDNCFTSISEHAEYVEEVDISGFGSVEDDEDMQILQANRTKQLEIAEAKEAFKCALVVGEKKLTASEKNVLQPGLRGGSSSPHDLVDLIRRVLDFVSFSALECVELLKNSLMENSFIKTILKIFNYSHDVWRCLVKNVIELFSEAKTCLKTVKKFFLGILSNILTGGITKSFSRTIFLEISKSFRSISSWTKEKFLAAFKVFTLIQSFVSNSVTGSFESVNAVFNLNVGEVITSLYVSSVNCFVSETLVTIFTTAVNNLLIGEFKNLQPKEFLRDLILQFSLESGVMYLARHYRGESSSVAQQLLRKTVASAIAFMLRNKNIGTLQAVIIGACIIPVVVRKVIASLLPTSEYLYAGYCEHSLSDLLVLENLTNLIRDLVGGIKLRKRVRDAVTRFAREVADDVFKQSYVTGIDGCRRIKDRAVLKMREFVQRAFSFAFSEEEDPSDSDESENFFECVDETDPRPGLRGGNSNVFSVMTFPMKYLLRKMRNLLKKIKDKAREYLFRCAKNVVEKEVRSKGKLSMPPLRDSPEKSFYELRNSVDLNNLLDELFKPKVFNSRKRESSSKNFTKIFLSLSRGVLSLKTLWDSLYLSQDGIENMGKNFSRFSKFLTSALLQSGSFMLKCGELKTKLGYILRPGMMFITDERSEVEIERLFLENEYLVGDSDGELFDDELNCSGTPGLKGGGAKLVITLFSRASVVMLRYLWKVAKFFFSNPQLAVLLFREILPAPGFVMNAFKLITGLSCPLSYAIATVFLCPQTFECVFESAEMLACSLGFDSLASCANAVSRVLEVYTSSKVYASVSAIREVIDDACRRIKLLRSKRQSNVPSPHYFKPVPAIRVLRKPVEDSLSSIVEARESLRQDLRNIIRESIETEGRGNTRGDSDETSSNFSGDASDESNTSETENTEGKSRSEILEGPVKESRANLLPDVCASLNLEKESKPSKNRRPNVKRKCEGKNNTRRLVESCEFLINMNSFDAQPQPPVVVGKEQYFHVASNSIREFYYMQEVTLFEIKTKLQRLFEDLEVCGFDWKLTSGCQDKTIFVKRESEGMVESYSGKLPLKKFDGHEFCYRSEGLVPYDKEDKRACIFSTKTEFLSANKFLLSIPKSRSVLYTNIDVKVVLYEAPPGGGKTTSLIDMYFDICSKRECMILTANKLSQEEILKKVRIRLSKSTEERFSKVIPKVFTIDAYLMNHLGIKTHTLFLDECFMSHAGTILSCLQFTSCAMCVLFGDSRQIHYIERNELDSAMLADLDLFIGDDARVYGDVSYRCPWDVCAWLSTFYPKTVATANVESEGKSSMQIKEIESVEDVLASNEYEYITMLQSEKQDLQRHLSKCGVKSNVRTTHEAQGETYSRVMLVRTKFQEDAPFVSHNHITVALSRHTESLTYSVLSARRGDAICDAIEKAQKLVNEFRIYPQSFGGSTLKLEGEKVSLDGSSCKASSAPYMVINDFLNDIVEGSAVVELGDLSAELSTQPFESGASDVTIRDSSDSRNLNEHGRQRV